MTDFDLHWRRWPRMEDMYPDPDCGCPVEEWVYCGITLTIHFETDGSLEVFADAGDWDQELPLAASTIERGRIEAWSWVDSLPTEEELGR